MIIIFVVIVAVDTEIWTCSVLNDNDSDTFARYIEAQQQ